MSRRRGPGRAHWRVVIDGAVYMFSNLSHAVPVLRELGVRVSASRLYNEYRDQVERVWWRGHRSIVAVVASSSELVR